MWEIKKEVLENNIYENLDEFKKELDLLKKWDFELAKNSEKISELEISNHDITYLSMIFDKINANQSTNNDLNEFKNSIFT